MSWRLSVCSVVLVLLVWTEVGAQESKLAQRPSPQEVSRLIADHGAKGAVRILAADPRRWDEVLEGIGSGRDEWLSLAKPLRPGTDAATAEGLAMALQEALLRSPAAVLRLTSACSDGESFPVRDACGGYGFGQIEDTRSKDTILKLIKRRVAAVNAVAERELDQVRRQCIDALEVLEQAIRKR